MSGGAKEVHEPAKDAGRNCFLRAARPASHFFKGLVDKLSDGADVKTLNSIAALWGKQTGNPNVTSYETALSLVGDEIVKAATGAGVAGALGDREEIKKNFDPSLSKDQLRANINAVQVLVGGAMTSTINKYAQSLSARRRSPTRSAGVK